MRYAIMITVVLLNLGAAISSMVRKNLNKYALAPKEGSISAKVLVTTEKMNRLVL